jgi:hypothetical protein
VFPLIIALQLAAGSSHLASAETACYQLDYTGCLAALQKAKAEPGNSRTALLRILELEGVTAAQLKQVMRAQDALRTLFLLDRDHKFTASYSPRVNTEILEAKAWAKASGQLVVTATEPGVKEGAVESLGLTVEHNPLGLARSIRVHQRTPGGKATVDNLPIGSGRLSIPAKGPAVEWWAEVIGANDAVLLELGSRDSPLVARAPEPVVTHSDDAPVKHELLPEQPVERLEAAPEPRGPRFRPAAWTTLALGAVFVGVGAFFAFSASSERNQLEHPMLDANGLVVGRTQLQTQDLDTRMQRDAWLANGLLFAGAAVGVAAITLFILGSR